MSLEFGEHLLDNVRTRYICTLLTGHFDFSPSYRTAEALIKYGALIVKDSRVSEQDNSVFLDLLEDYFAQPDEELEKDIRPEYGYQGMSFFILFACQTCNASATC